MKGRGTRTNDFKFHWISPNEIPDGVESIKEEFYLFDFMGNYEYFEQDYDYDEILELPKKPSTEGGEGVLEIDIGEVTTYIDDPLKLLEEIRLGNEGMRIDRDLYPSFKNEIQQDSKLQEMVANLNFKDAEIYLEEEILDRPEKFYTLDQLKKSLELDRKLTVSELLLYSFDHIDRIKSKRECLEEEFEQLDNTFHPSEEYFDEAKHFFESYVLDDGYRKIIDSKKFADLNVHPSGQAFKNISKELREQIPLYINENVDLERFISA